MMTRVHFEAILLAIVITGCSTPAVRDHSLGVRAEKAKDYVAAREAFQRHLLRAQQEHPPHQTRVLLATYELGRATGYTCDYAEAEKLLREALRLGELLPDQFSFRTATLSELARLSFDQGKFHESVSFYERAILRLEKIQTPDRDPIAFSMYLEDYAAALEQDGNADKAVQTRARAASIRSSNPAKSTKTAWVYYRDVCGKK